MSVLCIYDPLVKSRMNECIYFSWKFIVLYIFFVFKYTISKRFKLLCTVYFVVSLLVKNNDLNI